MTYGPFGAGHNLPRPVMGAEDLTEMLSAETARLRRIEVAARAVFECEMNSRKTSPNIWDESWGELAAALGEEAR